MSVYIQRKLKRPFISYIYIYISLSVNIHVLHIFVCYAITVSSSVIQDSIYRTNRHNGKEKICFSRCYSRKFVAGVSRLKLSSFSKIWVYRDRNFQKYYGSISNISVIKMRKVVSKCKYLSFFIYDQFVIHLRNAGFTRAFFVSHTTIAIKDVS
jgi:hypothetical protein